MPIAYVKHPVSSELKKELTSKGFKIIDAKFTPSELAKGDEVFPKKKAKSRAKKED